MYTCLVVLINSSVQAHIRPKPQHKNYANAINSIALHNSSSCFPNRSINQIPVWSATCTRLPAPCIVYCVIHTARRTLCPGRWCTGAEKSFSHLQETHARRGNQLVCVKSRQTDVIEPKNSPVFWHSWWHSEYLFTSGFSLRSSRGGGALEISIHLVFVHLFSFSFWRMRRMVWGSSEAGASLSGYFSLQKH